MAFSDMADRLATLQTSISSTTSLVNSFQVALQCPVRPHPKIENPPQPLALLSDSCRILKAQTTKLSLLMLNKPFTPSAITYLLTVCSGGCLPAMISALELCPPEKYSNLLHNQIKFSISRIMTEVLNLVASIPQDERGIEPQSRDTLASTGVLWAECDKMVKLASDGIVSLVAQKAEEYHSLLKDAIEELQQWEPEEEEDESDADSLLSQKSKSNRGPEREDSELATSFEALAVTDIVRLQKSSLSTLRTVRLLYPALKKRRIASFPNVTSSTTAEYLPRLEDIIRLDSMMLSAQNFTEAADEVAGALYEHDQDQVLMRLEGLLGEAKQCAIRTLKNWKGENDEFTEWANEFLARLKEVGEEGRRLS